MPGAGDSGAITAASLAVEFLANYQPLEAFANGGYAALKQKIVSQGGLDIPVLLRVPTQKEANALRAGIRKTIGSITVPWEFGAYKTKTDTLKRDINTRWGTGPALKIQRFDVTPEAASSLRSQIQKILDSQTFKINVQGNVNGVQGGGAQGGGMTGPMWMAPGNTFSNMAGVRAPAGTIDPRTGQNIGGRYTQQGLINQIDRQDLGNKLSLALAKLSQYQQVGQNVINAMTPAMWTNAKQQRQQTAQVQAPIMQQQAQQAMADIWRMRAEEINWRNQAAANARASRQAESIANAATRAAAYGSTIGLAGMPRTVPGPLSSAPGQMSLPFVQSAQGQMGLFGPGFNPPLAGGVPMNYQTRREMLDQSAMRAQSMGDMRRNMITDTIGPAMWAQIAAQRQQFRSQNGIGPGMPIPIPPAPPIPANFGGVQTMIQNKLMPSITGFVNRFGQNWEGAIRKAEGEARRHMFAGMTLSMAFTYPAMRVAKAGVGELTELDSSMAKSAALTSVPADEIKNIRKEIIGMSSDLPQSAKSLSDAFYYIASAGYKGSDSMEVLRAASKGAAGGLGETQVVADTTTSVLAAYNLQASKSTHVVDVLTAAVRVGKGEATDYAGAFAKVIPIASQAGISFEQVAASMATMTRIGLNPDETATAFRQLTANLVKPSRQSRQAMEQLGTSPARVRQSIKDEGFAATVQELMKLSGGNLDILDRLVGNIRGLTGYLATAGNQVDEYNSALRQMNSANGASEHSFSEMSKTLEFQWARLLNSGKKVFFQIGSEIIPRVATSVSGFADEMPGHVNTLVSAWNQLPRPLQVLAQAAGVFSVLSGPMLMNIAIARNLGAAFLTIAGGLRPLMLVAGVAAGLLYFTRAGDEAANSAQEQGAAYRASSGAAEGFRVAVRGLTIGVLGYLALTQSMRAGIALSGAFQAGIAGAAAYKASLIALRSTAQSAFAAEGMRGLVSTFMRPTGIPAANRLMTDTAGRAQIASMAIGPAFGGVAAVIGGVTAAVGLGAIAWQSYAASVNDAKLRYQELEGTSQEIEKMLTRMSKAIGTHNNGRKDYFTDLRTKIGLADTPEKSKRVLGSLNAKMEDIRVRPNMNELDRQVLLRQMEELRNELQQKMSLQVEIETKPGQAEQIATLFQDVWGKSLLKYNPGHALVEELKYRQKMSAAEENPTPPLTPGAFDLDVGRLPRTTSEIYDAITGSISSSPVAKPAINAAGAIIDRLLGTKGMQNKTDEQIKKAISQITDLKKLNDAYGALQKNASDAATLAKRSRIGEHLQAHRISVYDKVQAEKDKKKKQEEIDMFAAQEADKAARSAESERITKEISMWNSYSSVLDGVMGKIREFANRTEEARVTNELMKRTFDGITDSARNTALALAQVVDKMKALNELRGATSDLIGQAQSRLIGAGARSLPTAGIERVSNVLDFQDRMRNYQGFSIPMYQRTIRSIENTQAQRETRVNELQQTGVVDIMGMGGGTSGGPAPSWLQAMESNAGKTFGRDCAAELTARLRGSGVKIGKISAAAIDPDNRVGFDASGRLPAGTMVRWMKGAGGFSRGHFAAINSDQENFTESNMRRSGPRHPKTGKFYKENYISTDRDINWPKLRSQIQSGIAYAFTLPGALSSAARSGALSAGLRTASRAASKLPPMPSSVAPRDIEPQATNYRPNAQTPAELYNSFLQIDKKDKQRRAAVNIVSPRNRPGATRATIGTMQDFRNSEFDTAPNTSALPFGIGGGVLPLPGFENRFAFQQAMMRKDFLSKMQKGFQDLPAAQQKQVGSIERYIKAMWDTMTEFDKATAVQNGIVAAIGEQREHASQMRMLGQENNPFAQVEEEIRLARQNARPYTPRDASAKRYGAIQLFRGSNAREQERAQTLETEAFQRFQGNVAFLNDPSLFGDNTISQYERRKFTQDQRAQLLHDPKNQAGLLNRHTKDRTMRDINDEVARRVAGYNRDRIESTTGAIRQGIIEQGQALTLAQEEERLRRDGVMSEEQINVKLAARTAYFQTLNAAQRDSLANAEELAREAERAAEATAQQGANTAYYASIRNSRYQFDTQRSQGRGIMDLMNMGVRPDSPEFEFRSQIGNIATEVMRDRAIRPEHKDEEISRRQELMRLQMGTEQLKSYRNAVNEVGDSLATLGDESGIAAQTLQDLRNVIQGLPGADQIDMIGLAASRINSGAQTRLHALTQEDAMMRTLTETEKERVRNKATMSVFENNPALSPLIPQLQSAQQRVEEAVAQREINQLGYEQIKLSGDLATSLRKQSDERRAMTDLARQEVAWKYEDLELEKQLARIGGSLSSEDRADININRDVVRQQLNRDEWRNNFQSFGDNIRDSILNGFKNAAGGVKGILGNILGSIKDIIVEKGMMQVSNWLTSNILGEEWTHSKDNWYQQITGAMPGMPGMPVDNNRGVSGWQPDGVLGGMFQSILGINGEQVFRPQSEVSATVSSPVLGMAGTFLNSALNGQMGGLAGGLASGLGNTDTVTLNARTVNMIGGGAGGMNLGRRGASGRQVAGGLLGQLLGGI